MRRIIIDTDPGVDDAMAMWYLAKHPGIQIEAVSVCHGNVSASIAAGNAVKIMQLLDLPDVPIGMGSEVALERALGYEDHVHGNDGLGGAGGTPVRPGELPDSVDLLAEQAAAHPGELDLLVLGSLTNLGRLAIRDPGALLKFRSIVFLGTVGGTCEATAGHVIDANVAYDIGAARELQSLVPIRYIPVDVTSTVLFEEEDLDRVMAIDSPIADVVKQSLGVYIDSYYQRYGRKMIRMHDPAAAAVLAEEHLVDRWRPAVLDLVRTEHREGVRGVVVRTSPDAPTSGDLLSAGSAQGEAAVSINVAAMCEELLEKYES